MDEKMTPVSLFIESEPVGHVRDEFFSMEVSNALGHAYDIVIVSLHEDQAYLRE
jgi:hypothetical protein